MLLLGYGYDAGAYNALMALVSMAQYTRHFNVGPYRLRISTCHSKNDTDKGIVDTIRDMHRP